MRAAFVFDQERCTGCEACSLACGIENGRTETGFRDLGWRRVHTWNPARHPGFPTRHLSLACNHCDTPACLLGCPASAYRRDEATGAVLLDAGSCIGCRYCSWLCPYDVPRFDEGAGVMTKCTFCSHRLAEGRAPACAQACPTGALSIGDRALATAEPRLAGLPGLGLGPALVVVPPRERPTAASASPAAPGGIPALAVPPLQPVPPRKVRLSSEGGLILFTVAFPALVAWLGAGLLRPSVAPSPLAFVAVGLAALAVSAAHLGRPLRAWRAIANLRSSWLSREALLAPAFLGAAAASLLLPEGPARRGTAGAALLLGAGLLVSIDALYRAIPRLGAGGPLDVARLHAAEAWPTTLFLAGLLAGAPVLWGGAAALKLALLLPAAGDAPLRARRLPLPLLALRGLLLLAAAALAGAAVPAGPVLGASSGNAPAAVGPVAVLALALALAGELLDRARFYLELEPASPARLLATGPFPSPGPPGARRS